MLPAYRSRIPMWSPIINYLAKDITTLLPSCEDRILFDLGMMGGSNGSKN